jgi:hypothetical protein
MCTKDQWRHRQEKVIPPSTQVSERVNPDCGDNQTPDKVTFGGEAHRAT